MGIQSRAQRQAIKALASQTRPGPQNTTTCPIHISAKEDTNGAKDRRGRIWDADGPF